MGKKNRLKQLLGRFIGETNSELKALPYSFGDALYEMLLKIDLNHDKSLAIANVPYYLDEDTLKRLCSSSLGTDVAEINLTASTALHGNLKRGYRSGHLVFPTIHACRRAFDSLNGSMCPFKIESLNIKLPAWHKPIISRFGKGQRRKVTEGRKAADDETEVVELVGADQADADGWITVTRKHRFSFPGKTNQLAESGTNLTKAERNMEELYDPARKKRRR